MAAVAQQQLPTPPNPVTFQRILVPLDGSFRAEAALPYAARLAECTGARLVLVRVARAQALPGGDAAAAQMQAIDRAETYLERLIATTPLPGDAVASGVPYGDAAEGIVAAARTHVADLIVMATHGRSGLARAVLGSVAEGVLRRAGVPLMLVRPGVDYVSWESGLRSVLVPLDGSVDAETALPIAMGIARAAQADLALFRTVPPAPIALEGAAVAAFVDREAEREAARAYLRTMEGRVRAAGDPAAVPRLQSLVSDGFPATEIGRACDLTGASLVVMTTHGRTGVERALLGSVADEVVRTTRVPVLLSRARPEPASMTVI